MKSRRRPRTRTLLLISAGLLLAAWLVPPYFHAERYRRLLEIALESKLGRPVEIGAVSFRLLPHPGFSLGNVVVKEDPRFGAEPFARVGRVECNLRWRSLWRSRPDCATILLENPTLNLVRNEQGRWNVEDFFLRTSATARARATGRPKPSPSGFDLEVENGRVDFTLGLTKQPFAITALTGDLVLRPSARSVAFDFRGVPDRLDLPQPAPGTVELTGEWRPENKPDGPLHATVHTSGSLLYGWLPLLTSRSPGIFGLVDADLQLNGSVDKLRISGHIRVDQLHRWESLPPSSSMPVEISLKGLLDRNKQRLYIQQGDAFFADSNLRFTGALDGIDASPHLDFTVTFERSRLQDLEAIASRLSGRRPPLHVSGRTGGMLTVQGPWRSRRYSGILAMRSVRLRAGRLTFSAHQARVRIDSHGVHLLPVRFLAGPQLECVAEGTLPLATPGSSRLSLDNPLNLDNPLAPLGERVARGVSRVRGSPKVATVKDHATAAVRPHYELVITAERAPIHELLRLAQSLGVRSARDLDAQGWADATLRLTGGAWPFEKPQITAGANLHHAKLLVPGLTEPLRLTRFHLLAQGQDILVDPLTARLGPVEFSGWLERPGARGTPWEFNASSPRLSLEQASLWFAVLGHKSPLPILDLIPGLRSLVARRRAGRNIFASVNARGSFASPLVTFRSVRLKNVHADIDIRDRVATVENAGFQVAGGAGSGSARINFKRAPARIAGSFRLAGGQLSEIAWRLPPALDGLSGRISAAGQFTTTGLTRQEISAGLAGEVTLHLANILLGSFDPLQSLARSASLGVLRPERGSTRISSATLNVQIRREGVTLAPVDLRIAGAVVKLSGNCGFDGRASVYARSDLSRVRRKWLRAGETPLSASASGDLVSNPSSGSDPVPDAGQNGIETRGFMVPEEASRLPRPESRVAAVHLAGRMNSLALVEPTVAGSVGFQPRPRVSTFTGPKGHANTVLGNAQGHRAHLRSADPRL